MQAVESANMMQTSNFWVDDSPRPAGLARAELPERVDVVVIGGGYTGLHAAIALRQAGASVAVLEQETIGWGASSRNGGMVLTGLKQEMPALFRRYGSALGRRFWEWSLAAIDHLEQTLAAERIDCDFARTGHLLLAAKPKHFANMAHEVAWMRRKLGDSGTRLVSPDEMHMEIGARLFYGGLADSRSSGLHPAKYVFGLAQAAARYGVVLVERAQVTGLQRRPGGFSVGVSRGLIETKELLVAINGYTANLVPAVRSGIFAVGSYIIVTAPLPAALQDVLSPRRRMFFDSKHFLNYFRLTPDGRMLFGGRHDLSTDLDPTESAGRMRQRMVQIFPALADVAITHSWSGRLGVSFDLMPHAGYVDGIHYAGGYAGHGVAIAGYLGKEIGEIIAGRRPSTPFAEISHARYPFTRYDKLYLPLIAAWFRLLDRVQ